MAIAFVATANAGVAAFAGLAAILPDRFERIVPFFRMRHRGFTHAIALWLPLFGFLIFLSFAYPPSSLMRFLLGGVGFGYLAHLLCDMASITGIPWTPGKKSGRLALKWYRTGGFSEYLLLGALLIVSLLAIWALYPTVFPAGTPKFAESMRNLVSYIYK